jgi:methionyl-tRNA formyltransferase
LEQWRVCIHEHPDLLPSELLTLDPTIFNHSLLQRPIQLAVVVTQPDSVNHGRTTSNKVAKWCREQNITLFQPEKLNRALDDLQDMLFQPLDLGVVASYGQILSSQTLDLAQYGMVNWHPSRLPQFRGPTPMNETLKSNLDHSALTWICMTKEMDAGDILLQLPLEITSTWTYSELSGAMVKLGAATWALVAALKVLSQEKAFPFPLLSQDHTQATVTHMLTKDMALVDTRALTAAEVYGHWRGNVVFPGTKIISQYFGQLLKLIQCQGYCTLLELENLWSENQVLYQDQEWLQLKMQKQTKTFLQCAANTWLEVSKIMLENGKTVDFSGYQFKGKSENPSL